MPLRAKQAAVSVDKEALWSSAADNLLVRPHPSEDRAPLEGSPCPVTSCDRPVDSIRFDDRDSMDTMNETMNVMDDIVLYADQNRFWLRTCSYSVQGNRQYQEDEVLCGSDEDFIYYGVFDGHGGRQASEFAKEHLVANIKMQEGILDEDSQQVIEAIKAGFAETQKTMECAADDWPKTSSGHRSTAGTTASLVLIDRRRSRLFTAHLGDSRVLLGRCDDTARSSSTDSSVSQSDCDSDEKTSLERDPEKIWSTNALTIDHKPECETERERIWRHGGSIMVKYNVPRVVWRRKNRNNDVLEQVPFLAIARSLGDFWSYNYDSGEYIVSPVPDVECIPITSDFRCLVLGSDGLFNMLGNSEVVQKVQEVEEYLTQLERFNLRASRDPAHELVRLALFRWRQSNLRSDNISVLTVAFRSFVNDISPEQEVPIKPETEEITGPADFLEAHPVKNNALATRSSSDDENSLLRQPLNHLNQNRTCGSKRSRSLDSFCAKQPRLHQMDLRGARDRACKRAASVSSGTTSTTSHSSPSSRL